MVNLTADEPANTYRLQYDWSTKVTPSTGVIETIAAVEDRDMADYPPLHDAIDTDSLDELLGGGDGRSADVRVEFSYDGYDVVVSSGGTVAVARS